MRWSDITPWKLSGGVDASRAVVTLRDLSEDGRILLGRVGIDAERGGIMRPRYAVALGLAFWGIAVVCAATESRFVPGRLELDGRRNYGPFEAEAQARGGLVETVHRVDPLPEAPGP